MKKSKILITAVLMFLFTLCIAPITTFAATTIDKVEIGGSKFNYNAGDKPEAYAIRSGDTAYYYDIEYEYWEEMETNASGESNPVKFWYSDDDKNNALAEDKKITTFEEGKTYMYSISLKARDGYTFADNAEVFVNSDKVNALNVTKNESGLFITAIKTIKPTKSVQKQYIDEVEISNATVIFKAGDKPVFTGKVSDDAPYVYRAEFWETDGGNKGHNSSSMWNDNNPDKLFNTFENGKTYTYGIYFVSYDYKGYFFTRDTKLKINGKYYNYRELEWESQPDVNEFSTMWITTDLTMTPTSTEQPTQDTVKVIESSSSIKGSIAFEKEVSKNYALDIKQAEVSKNLSDKNVKYLVDIKVLENGQIVKIDNTKMKIKIALPEYLKGYQKYEVVYILNDEIKETIPATIEDGYIVFEASHLSKYGIVATEKSSGTNVENPKTGDNVMMYLATGILSIIGLAGASVIVYRKKQTNYN